MGTPSFFCSRIESTMENCRRKRCRAIARDRRACFVSTVGLLVLDWETSSVRCAPVWVGGVVFVSHLCSQAAAEAGTDQPLSVIGHPDFNVKQGFGLVPADAPSCSARGNPVLRPAIEEGTLAKRLGGPTKHPPRTPKPAPALVSRNCQRPITPFYFKFLRLGLVALLAWGPFPGVTRSSPSAPSSVWSGFLASFCPHRSGSLNVKPLRRCECFRVQRSLILMVFIFDGPETRPRRIMLARAGVANGALECQSVSLGSYVLLLLSAGSWFGISTAMAFA